MKKLYNLVVLVAFFGLLFSYTAVAQPKITSFTPVSGSVGTLVTITGTNLESPSAFTIGGNDAIIVSNTGTTLTAFVMPGTISGNISLTTAGGTALSTSSFTITPTSYPSIQQGGILRGTDESNSVWQGWAVSLSADGNTAIVAGSFTEAVWIYTRNGKTWSQQGSKLVVTDITGNAYRYTSVSLSADGNTAMLGICNDNSGIGAAWVFARSGSTWAQQGNKLVGTGAVGNAHQGSSVSLSADGNTAIVGGSNDNSGVGAAWVFTRTGSTWTQQGNKLVGTGATGQANQGRSVSLSADGNTAIVGGSNDNSNVGATWVFTRSGSTWTQQGSKLVGTGATGNAYQGTSVSLSADGNTIISGGPNDNSGAGAAWVFTRSGSTWTQQGSKLVGTGATGNAGQGRAVSLSADGNTAIVGGYEDNSELGATWVFTRSGIIWTQQGNKLVGTGVTGNAGGLSTLQGISVSLSADGNTAFVGGPFDYGGVGSAWVFIALVTPTTQTANVSFANVSATQMNIKWDNGNGTSRAVFVKEGTEIITNPSDNTTYAANTNWATKGTQLGTSGYYCIYNGTGSSVTLTGLSALTECNVQVFEYNGTPGREMYLTTAATNNPNKQTTKGTQTITITPLAVKTYGDPVFTISATGGASGNPVTFTSSNTAIATCTGTNGATVTIRSAGSCTIYANQAASASYLAAPQVSQTLTINKKILTVSGATPANKVYDGSTTATISGATLVGIINSDFVYLTNQTSGTFVTANVGTGIAVSSAMVILGVGNGNYTMMQPTGLTANITAKKLTVTSAKAGNKVYDGTTAATISGSTLAGIVGSDDVALVNTTSGNFATANAGTDKAVTTTMNITGASIGNYSLTQPSLTANITAKELTVIGANANNKVYDGTTTATISGATLAGIVGSDDVTFANANSGNFATATVGTDKTVTTTMTITGASIDNYSLAQPILKANIAAAPITIAPNAGQSKKVGAADPIFAYTISSGVLVNGDLITGALTRVAGETAGNYAIQIGTLTAGSNYNITFVPADFIITPSTAVSSICASKPNVYPNPTSGLINLDVPEGKVTLLDVEGKVLIETTLGKDKTIDIAKYHSGIYILILKTNETIYDFKIMKQ